MIKRIFRWLSDFLRRKDPEIPTPFPDFSIDDLAVKLNILAEAEEQGKKNKPNDADGLLISGTEAKIKQEITSRLTKCHEQVQSAINTLSGEIKSINFEQYFQQLDYKSEQTEADLESSFARGLSHLSERRKEVTGIKRDFETFKLNNKINSFPDYPDSMLFSWGLLIFIVIIESMFNAYFFAEGSDLGLLGGALQALVISVLNVGIAYIVANYIFRYVNHQSAAKRTLAIACFVIYMILLAGFVYAITHYRDAFTVNPDNAWPIALSKIINLEFSFLDVNSYMFLALSAAMAFLAFIKSYSMDDRYPKYGKIHRRLLSAEADLRSESNELIDDITAIKEDSDRELEEIRENVQESYNVLNLNIKDTFNLVDIYDKYHHKLIDSGDALVSQYRQKNTLQRTDTAPSSFSHPIVFGTDNFQLNTRELKGFDTVESNWLSFDKKIESTQLDLEKMLKEYINKFEIKDGQA